MHVAKDLFAMIAVEPLRVQPDQNSRNYLPKLPATRSRSFAKLAWGFALVALLALLPKVVSAQLIIEHLHQPPPNELKASDLWVVDITNPTKTSYVVYLHATATELSNPMNPILVADAQTASFSVPPGFMRVTASEISPIKVNTSDPTYRGIVTATGDVPSGDYQVCVEVVQKSTGQILGKDCYDQQIDRTTPPVLVMPMDGSVLTNPLSLFNWIAPAPLTGMKAGYTIKIVELLGNQTAYDAMQSNPAFYTASAIPNTLYQYPLAAHPFLPGREYAWQISAVTTNTPRPISLGSSEVWEFSYDPNALNGGDLGSGVGGEGTGSNGNGTSGSGNAIGSLDLGKFSDSVTLYNILLDYFQDNFFIPAGYNNLFPGDDVAGIDAFNDPNATGYVANTPNDSSSTTVCGRAPSVTLAIVPPPFDQKAVNWHEPFGMSWSVRHSHPIDHIDLEIALFGHEDAPLAHFIYRTASGSVPTATTFDPRPYILNPDAEGMICVVTVVAVDVLGRSSGPVQKLYINGTFPSIPHIAAPSFVSGRDAGSRSMDSILILPNGALSSHRVVPNPTGGAVTLTLLNHDSAPHHYRSSYTPPYAASLPLPVGNVQALDFGDVMPGATASVTLPAGVPDCYLWILYDLEQSNAADQANNSFAVVMSHK